MFPTAVCGTERGYLTSLTGLKELAVVGEGLAYYGNRCTGINEGSHRAGFRIFETIGTSCLNNVM